MSSSGSSLVVPTITENSTVSELLSLLRVSFFKKEFDEVERILTSREEGMKMESRILKRALDESEMEKNKMIEKMKGEFYVAEKPKKKMIEEMKRKFHEAQMEKQKIIEKLMNENREAEETIELFGQKLGKLEERLSHLEETVACLSGVDVSDFRSDNFDRNDEVLVPSWSHSASNKYINGFPVAGSNTRKLQIKEGSMNGSQNWPGAQATCDSTGEQRKSFVQEKENNGPQPEGSNNSKLQIKEGSMNCQNDIQTLPGAQAASDSTGEQRNSFGQEKENCGPQPAALVSMSPGSENEFNVRKQLVLGSSSLAVPSSITQFPSIIEIFETNDEMPVTGEACCANICVSQVNSSKKEATDIKSGTSGCSIQTNGEKFSDGTKDPLVNLQPKRKRSLTKIDDHNDYPICRQKIGDRWQQYHDGKCSCVSDITEKLDLVATSMSQATMPCMENHLLIKRRQQKDQLDCSLRIPLRELCFDNSDNSCSDGSTDSQDESCTDSYMDKLVANLWKNREKTWMFAADMLSDFQKDSELCMNAICALYRTQISAEKSISSSLNPAHLGFSHFDAMRGKELAEFLINGDPEYRLKRTLSEVQEKNPEVVSKCKDLATQYYEKLFEIYLKNEDPFFRPR